MENLSIHTANGHHIEAQLYSSNQNFQTVVLIVCGVGVKQKYYQKFATYLSQQNFAVYTFDYKGIGKSKPKTLVGFETNVTEWAEQDIEGMLQYIRQKHTDKKINIVAHSGGGSILGLAPSAKYASAIIMVASPRCFRYDYSGSSYWKMCLIVFLLYPFFSNILGYFPSKFFRIGEDLPKGVALEWAKWGRHSQGLDGYIGTKNERFDAITASIWAVSFDNDFFAGKTSVDNLRLVYKNANVKRTHFTNKDVEGKTVNHFCFFKSKFQDDFWQKAVLFLNAV